MIRCKIGIIGAGRPLRCPWKNARLICGRTTQFPSTLPSRLGLQERKNPLERTGDFVRSDLRVTRPGVSVYKDHSNVKHLEYFIAFRDILAISSGVFYSMFYGPLAKPRDSQNDPVVDEDINPEAFRLMLEYVLFSEKCCSKDRIINETLMTTYSIVLHLSQNVFFVLQVYLYRKHRSEWRTSPSRKRK